MPYLTERQRDVLRFIAERVAAEGVAPTLREIAEAFDFSSTASAQKHIALLEKKGYLRRTKHQKRGLEVLKGAAPPETGAANLLPLLGTVAAGSPIEAYPDDESVTIPPYLLRSGEHYVLRVRGESMIDDGIHDGDMVVVQRTATARDGEMVVALVSGEVTLKRLFRTPGGAIRLQPANAAIPPFVLPASHVQVQGVVVGLIRRY